MLKPEILLVTVVQVISFRAMPEVLPQPEVIITHESDLDGLIAGVLLQRLAGSSSTSTHRWKPIITTPGVSAMSAKNRPGSPISLSSSVWTRRTG